MTDFFTPVTGNVGIVVRKKVLGGFETFWRFHFGSRRDFIAHALGLNMV
jgi:hypothetical protein